MVVKINSEILKTKFTKWRANYKILELPGDSEQRFIIMKEIKWFWNLVSFDIPLYDEHGSLLYFKNKEDVEKYLNKLFVKKTFFSTEYENS